MVRAAMVVGGAGGIGAAVVSELVGRGCERVVVVDRSEPAQLPACCEFVRMSLISDPIEWLEPFVDQVDALVITAGAGRIAWLDDLEDAEVASSLALNAEAPIGILRLFWRRIRGTEPFSCAVMGSIAGHVSSPLYSVYAAGKAALARFVESANAELAARGLPNRVLEVAPGRVEGTRFHGQAADVPELVAPLAKELVDRMLQGQEIWIPSYEETYADVIARYQADPSAFGLQSARYKEEHGGEEPRRAIVGYLTGTFDLFHVGHLNLLRRAKRYVDYLVVGVHPDGTHKNCELAVPLEERMAILRAVRYVDRVIVCGPEDTDDYDELRYDYLFVGSDYQGSERFERYERELGPKGVRIVYLPYTVGTSSTMLRNFIGE